MLTYINFFGLEAIPLHSLGALHGFGGEHLLQPGSPCGQRFLHADIHAAVHESRLLGHGADHRIVQFQLFQKPQPLPGHFRQDVPQPVLEQNVRGHLGVYDHAQPIAESHLRQGSRRASGI